MQDLKQKIAELSERLGRLKEALNLPEKKKRLEILEAKSRGASLWDDKDEARKVMQELSDIKQEFDEVGKLSSEVEVLLGLSSENELEGLEKEVKKTQKDIERQELKSFLSDEHDSKNAILSVHSGQGGTEAMDWANMLFRMYTRYCERKGFVAATLDYTAGDEAGIKSATIKIEGRYAYGYLKGESGTHRLVRQSPFNADKLRQTSFALVEVLPELSEVDLPDIVVKDEDLDWQFFRSSSQGGQNVQKVSTAVRLIHKPTGIAVTAQAERFQERNRKIALDLLKTKLWMMEKTRAKEEKTKLKGEYSPASWGTQIRSYVLHPYKMVKDLRTSVEVSDTEAVLDGEIDEFIEAEVKKSVQP